MTRSRLICYLTPLAICTVLVGLMISLPQVRVSQEGRERNSLSGTGVRSAVGLTQSSSTLSRVTSQTPEDHSHLYGPQDVSQTTSSEAKSRTEEKAFARSVEEFSKGLDREVEGQPLPAIYAIHGTVTDVTPDTSPDNLARLTASRSEKDFQQALLAILAPRPLPNIVVTVQNRSLTREVVTDTEGRFRCSPLLSGMYEVSTAIPPQIVGARGEHRATVRHQVTLDADRNVRLELRTDLVSITGKITDTDGRTIAGAKITGKQVFNQDHSIAYEDDFPTKEISAVSDSNGVYELHGFDPSSLFRTACYLMGTMNELALERVDVHVLAEGYIQSDSDVPRVPLVTEAMLDPARRLQNALLQMPESVGFPQRPSGEKVSRTFPVSNGNNITNIDIVLGPVR